MSNLTDIAAGPTENKVTKKEVESAELELKRLEIEQKKLEILEKTANLQDIQERLAERELKRETKKQRSLTNGATLTQLAHNDEVAQRRCNHKKGGNGANGVIGGQGDDSQYAVMKHIFANGDMWVRCLRCGKHWKPVLREWFKTDEEYLKKQAEYEAACLFQTRNVTSGAIQFRFSDNGVYYRTITKSSTLR